ncbi:hypothetical protein E2562_023837 [Oryza meyeriana var. granulata]|uniref:Uncharacterized protein n=1 Tax=Oryza meyeriana var. granulata TaxID=110450 RepID=A0A6G1CE26_9ORYZ|nr:hypothetical protein E2562_007275 [Oryza meyeriana var. granulata]KAF0908212.1 hypothetical protein E2562_023837 [Oryza meyeriana var. granulata]
MSGHSSDRRRSGTCSDFHVTCGAGGGGTTNTSGKMWASNVGEVRMRDVSMAMEFSTASVGGARSGFGRMRQIQPPVWCSRTSPR